MHCFPWRMQTDLAQSAPQATLILTTTHDAETCAGAAAACARIDAARWLDAESSLLELDSLVHAAEDRARASGSPLTIVVLGDASRAEQAAAQVAVRYQRLFSVRNEDSERPWFTRAASEHRRMHDLGKPLVRADYEHACDVWQWVLRLCPQAGAALQLAALFHDIERLRSEPEIRVEQHASDYLAFKLAHARQGASIMAAALTGVVPDDVLQRSQDLVIAHEQPGDDQELGILNDADALSFFSLNSPGFYRYYGPEHTLKKVRYTLARMRSSQARDLLGTLRLEPFVAHALERALAQPAA